MFPTSADSAEGPGADTGNRNPGDRPTLGVTDALSFLDAVKHQYHDKPEVYNQFLDIMKDFRNEVIATPVVIERVSLLFSGEPELMQGFNAFVDCWR